MEFAEELLTLAATGDIDAVLACAFKKCGHAIGLCDNAFGHIAEVGMDLLPCEPGRPADEDRGEQIEWLRTMSLADGPVIDERSGNPFRAMCADVVFRGEHIAKLIVFETHPFTEEDKRTITLLAAALAGILVDETGAQRLAGNLGAGFLNAVLAGRVPKVTAERVKRETRYDRVASWRIAATVAGGDKVPDAKQQARILKGISPCFGTVNDDAYCVLFPSDAEPVLRDNLCKVVGGTMGVSRAFRDIIYTPEHLEQARYALKTAVLSAKEYLRYDGLMLKETAEMLMRLPGGPARIRPEIIALSQYDRTHETELTDTLRTYLVNDRSLTETAKALFLHYNTVKYRMGMIREVTGLAAIDMQTACELLLSFEMFSGYVAPKKA
ncbi:MAG: helix-turn-helix domain-containing protein [Clostridia bacterium]|nr:helix-turn-helix domain-containing protein [Clostridia bacterium]